MRDIHNAEKSLNKLMEKIEKSNVFSKENKESILKFFKYCIAQGLKNTSIRKDIYSLRFIAAQLGDKNFKNASKDDFVEVISKINRRDWTEQTKRNHKVALKKFMKWLAGIEKKGIYPENVDWISTSFKRERKVLPDDLITKEEFDKMISVCDDIRDKAMLYLLFETGMRIGELLNLQIKNIVFEDDLALLMLNGKTGMRRIPIVASVKPLTTLLQNHSDKKNLDAYLFLTKHNHIKGLREIGRQIIDGKEKIIRKAEYVPLDYQGARKVLRNVCKKAGITKRIYPHLFRHTSGTDKSSWMSDRENMEFHGWSNPDIIRTYSHLSVKDLIDSVKTHYGIKEKEAKERKVEDFMIAFMKVLEKKMPSIKDDFRKLARDMKMEEVFG